MITGAELAIAIAQTLLLLTFGIGGFVALVWVIWGLIFPYVD